MPIKPRLPTTADLLPNPCPGEILRLVRYFGMSEGFFLGLQTDHDLMAHRRQIGDELKAIRPRAV